MKKKKRIFIAISALVLCAVAVGVLTSSGSWPPTRIIGNFEPQEIAEIKSAVRRQLWHDVLPDFSWQSIRHSPRGLYYAVAGKPVIIEATPHVWSRSRETGGPVVSVIIAVGKPTHVVDIFTLFKFEERGWLCYRIPSSGSGMAGWTSYSPLVSPTTSSRGKTN